ncbi:MAG: hypothetical protein QF890_09230 [Myxococcota bacterium]|nr:hypothetical protein [Myxococcota bacterium]MDP7076332.1 hypothetical protein [Myxococcota bacterium]MDP7299996.1 hypothetical protein [Myxococcota bacterium]MDP7432741.1 hypothetical protein [Myxococcota bacterium]MDP7571449.1 hypothetical protein [Myxococcota bacterium]
MSRCLSLSLCLAVASAGLLAGAASAAPPRAEVHGTFCTHAGCTGAQGGTVARAAAFGLTVGAVLWIGRRRTPPLP